MRHVAVIAAWFLSSCVVVCGASAVHGMSIKHTALFSSKQHTRQNLSIITRWRGGAQGAVPLNRPTTFPATKPKKAISDNETSQILNLKNILKTDSEGGQQYSADFMVRDRRIGFIRKVYSTLAIQLLVTGAVCFHAQIHRKQWLSLLDSQLGNVMYGLSLIGSIGVMLALHLSEGLRRTFPKNMALLGLFTICESIAVAMFTLFFKTASVWNALLQTGLATGALTAYAFQTNPKYDLTVLGSVVYSAAWCLLGFGIMTFFFRTPLVHAVYSTFAALAISLFLVYDTQMIIGGKHRQRDQIDSKDYVMGSLCIYLDIINLFLHLLRLFGQPENSHSS